jgi:crotonobetainyl-CoA:carnitine CoA-transferase CaiB-like acyl-CoA transferase
VRISIEIDKEKEQRLAAAGVKDAGAFASQAVDELLAELEDARIAAERLNSPEGWVSQEELERSLGLES